MPTIFPVPRLQPAAAAKHSPASATNNGLLLLLGDHPNANASLSAHRGNVSSTATKLQQQQQLQQQQL
jgi:hypothetical protein